MKWGLLFLLTIVSTSSDAELENRVMALSQQLRCLVCQNETLADSHADLAVDLRTQIRGQMKAGKSDNEILTYLTDRYGDFILYRPPVKPRTYLLWFGPFLLASGGMFTLYRFLKQRSGIEGRPLSPDDRKRARQLLRQGVPLEANLEVYRNQFAELESDFHNGFLTKAQFEVDREELERRLLEDVVPSGCRGGL